ncbi:MAG: hypothetical protein E6Y08_21450 [Paenibacillus sp.]|uniref:hypothetical protein n=1 Tax=Paenibacillus sp. TaxID=58172 RepID=UPI00290A1F3B|nr:hypothetical protein [Paenibacillus sp.]MDU4698385.1 hypothetical protein [Paenibacillus sp.]
MSVIYISNLIDTEDPNVKVVGYIHLDPLNEKYGLGQTEEQLSESGVLINREDYFEPENNGKIPRLLYNVETGDILYNYSNPAPDLMEELRRANEATTSNSLLAMEALTETFETVLTLHDIVLTLQAEIETLKNGSEA